MTQNFIITGAGTGIGKGTALQLTKNNHHVFAIGRRLEPLEALKAQAPDNITLIQADIASADDRDKIAQTLGQKKIAALINNAGIAQPMPMQTLTESHLDRHFNVNLKGALFLSQRLLDNLKEGGRILNVSTGLAHFAAKDMAPYGISKAALFAFYHSANTEWDELGITTGSMMPGVVATEMQDDLRSHDAKDFGSAHFFKGLKERNELLPLESVGKFITWLVTQTPSRVFKSHEWSIYDEWHQKYWADANEITPRTKLVDANALTQEQMIALCDKGKT